VAAHLLAAPRAATALALAGAVLLAGCQGAGTVDKSGGSTVVLRLATIDKVNNNGQSYGPEAFVEAIEQVSGGRLRVEVTPAYGDGAHDAESRLVEAVASGDLDGGWPSTRAFAEAGIPGLGAVEAPMTLTSYAAEKALVSGTAGQAVLAQLEGSGVRGLGLAVGPLRRPFAADGPLLGPGDWAGTRFRVYNSPVQARAMRALGAEPVSLGFAWVDAVREGTLRGAEFDIAQYESNDLNAVAGQVTANVVLWPKVFVLAVSEKRFASLDEQQRGWLRDAAEQAAQVSVDAEYDEDALARKLCERGVRFVDASAQQLADLRRDLQPVLAELAADPEGRPVWDAVSAVAAEHSGVEPLDVPAECRRVS